MNILFCCPTCGTDLRVNPDTALMVSCPGCGEPIRVPRMPHRIEADATAHAFPQVAIRLARRGVTRLELSLLFFALAATLAAVAIALKIMVLRVLAPPPAWLAPLVISCSAGWTVCAAIGSWLRSCGYRDCRSASHAVGVEGWAQAALWGTLFSLFGVVAVGPCLIGRPILQLPTEWLALVMVGLVCGLFGVLLEFAFLSVLHRLLWESSGWQAANRTGQYIVSFVFCVVVALGSACLGGMAIVLLHGGEAGAQPPGAPPIEIHFEYRMIGLAVLAAIVTCGAWAGWRYAQLLKATKRILANLGPLPIQVSNPF